MECSEFCNTCNTLLVKHRPSLAFQEKNLMKAQHLRSDRFPTPDGLAMSRVFLRRHLLFAMILFALFSLILPTQPALAITVLSNPAGASYGNYQLIDSQFYAVKFTVPAFSPGTYPGYRIDSATVDIINDVDYNNSNTPFDVTVDIHQDGGTRPGAWVGRLGTTTTTPTSDPVPYLFDDNPLPVEAGKTYWLVVNGPPGSGGAIMGIELTDSTPSGLFTYNGCFFYDAGNPHLFPSGWSGNACSIFSIEATPAIGPTGMTLNNPSPNALSSVTWTVSFSGNVFGLSTSNFTLVPGGGISGASITNIGGGNQDWEITVNTGSGSGTLGLNLNTTGLSGQLNLPVFGSFTGPVYTIDKTPPTVTSITGSSNNPTNQGSVQYAVQFSEAVTGVQAANFSLTTSGVSGASIGTVSGNGTDWTVTVNTGSGDGTIQLSMVNSTGVTDQVGYAVSNLTFDGSIYNIDKTPPTVTINQEAGQADPTNASPIVFQVSFSEPVENFGEPDIDLSNSTAPGPLVAQVFGAYALYTVEVTGMTGNGTVVLNIAANAANDPAGNQSSAPTIIDNTVTYMITTTTTLGASPSSAVYGQTVILTATVNPTAATGAMTFQEGGLPLACSGGQPRALSGGSATCTVTGGFGLGPHNFTADYSSDNGYASSQGTTSLTVNKANTTTTITSDNPDPSAVSNPIAVNFAVAATAPGTGTPTGTVTVTANSGESCGPTPLSGGIGSCNLTFTSAETKTLTATYAGDANFNGSSDTENHEVLATTAQGDAGGGLVIAAITGGTCTGFANGSTSFLQAPPPPFPGILFPYGLFGFTAICPPQGGTLTLTMTYPNPLPPGTQYWKFGPTADNNSPHWYVLPATLAGNTATFTITDGSMGDDDLVADGDIVDQGGPGVPNFVDTAAGIPTLHEWALLLFGALFGGLLWRMRRRFG
ncbi:MAG: IPTL-CTERM sorting domain-containing protein [Candidatus Contendobacter sp.]|nr:IPTL-CTERM sorting domain-containing protein [Candidatus Contendobacter sp.]MDG4556946.1 IPTL-CTERM sorting domain-containing protein [Candidatus Contendobacter sp.]